MAIGENYFGYFSVSFAVRLLWIKKDVCRQERGTAEDAGR
jgi:hypothetical protein